MPQRDAANWSSRFRRRRSRSRGQLGEVDRSPPVHLGNGVGVMPLGGRAAAAMAEAGGGVAQVEAADGELAGGVVPSALDVEFTPAASGASATLRVAQSGFHGRAWDGSLDNRYASSRSSVTEPERPLTWEPVSGIEPLTCRLQEVRPRAPYALAAPIARVTALTALAALGLSGAPFHEPFHAGGRWRSMNVTKSSDRNTSPRCASLRAWPYEVLALPNEVALDRGGAAATS